MESVPRPSRRFHRERELTGLTHFLYAAHIPVPKYMFEHNRCELKPQTPNPARKAPFLVALQRCPALYTVYFGLPEFRVADYPGIQVQHLEARVLQQHALNRGAGAVARSGQGAPAGSQGPEPDVRLWLHACRPLRHDAQ